MSKSKSFYSCQSCGAQFPKWAGQCGECGAWNTLHETRADTAPPRQKASQGYAGQVATVTVLNEVRVNAESRTPTGLSELDRVLGGGLVEGSVVLIGGDPGIGKSTILLQTLTWLAQSQRALYVTGEESLGQVAMRAKRLELPCDRLRIMAETCVENIAATLRSEKPAVAVIDSIQTLYTEAIQSAPGGVSQIRESAAILTRYAKQTGTALFLVGHVTKEGALAGPRVLEHMVDCVLYFEGESDSRFRMIRAVKNRFGAVNELGVFAMTDRGLREVANPSAIFLSRYEEPIPGSIVMISREGTPPLAGRGAGAGG
jgi:DNA repair protein RadA/Sms